MSKEMKTENNTERKNKVTRLRWNEEKRREELKNTGGFK